MRHTATDVAAFLDYLERICRRSPHTVRSYATSLDQFRVFLRSRHRCARSADFEDMLEFAGTLHLKAPATARTRLSAVKAFYRYLHALGHVERNYAELVPLPAKQKGCRPAHDAEAVERVRCELTCERDRAVFGLAYDGLLRISELRMILMDDLNLSRRIVTVVGKGNRLRTIELDRRTCRALAGYIEHERIRPTSRWLFPSHKAGADRPITEMPIRYALARAVERAGVQGTWTPHALRRSMGRHLRKAGADPFLVRDAFGHEHMSVTADYVAGTGDVIRLPDELRDAVRAMGGAQADGEGVEPDASSARASS